MYNHKTTYNNLSVIDYFKKSVLRKMNKINDSNNGLVLFIELEKDRDEIFYIFNVIQKIQNGLIISTVKISKNSELELIKYSSFFGVGFISASVEKEDCQEKYSAYLNAHYPSLMNKMYYCKIELRDEGNDAGSKVDFSFYDLDGDIREILNMFNINSKSTLLVF